MNNTCYSLSCGYFVMSLMGHHSKPIRVFVYIRACEFQYELLNFTTKFGTKYAIFREKVYEINCKLILCCNLSIERTKSPLSIIFNSFEVQCYIINHAILSVWPKANHKYYKISFGSKISNS